MMRSIKRVKLILPALTEASSPYWRPIKYSLFPPLGLATLAAYLDPQLETSLQDEHVEKLDLNDDPDLVIIQVYITNAYRAYRIADHYRARGAYVALGGLHVTSLPDEAAPHADTILLGPGEHIFPQFLRDLASGTPQPRYESSVRTLEGLPPIRRDLIQRHRYLVPNSVVVSRGCPHHCTFCYKDGFFAGGRSFYTQLVDDALAEIARLPGRHLYFLDDHLFGNSRFARELFRGMKGMGRVFQGAATVDSILRDDLIEDAAAAGLRSLFVGFETLNCDLYDTRHVVYRPSCMSPAELKRGYDWAYESFYRCSSILKAASAHESSKHSLKHFFYSAGWKKFERAWDLVIRIKQLSQMRPILEAVLAPVAEREGDPAPAMVRLSS